MLTEKRIVITGAGSGIGRATSILAAGYGAKVVCVDLNESVSSTVDEIKRALEVSKKLAAVLPPIFAHPKTLNPVAWTD